MPNTKPAALPTLYANAVLKDPETGAPLDYTSVFVGYRNLTLSLAEKAKIPQDEREDAAQEIQLRFWLRDSLAKYDPTKTFEHKDGQKRRAKFVSMYKSYATLSMLAERDKSVSSAKKYDMRPIEDMPEFPDVNDPVEDLIEQDAAQRWANTAERALHEAGRPELVPVLRLCQNAAVLALSVTRADIVAATGCKLREATAQLTALRSVLAEAGMGPESLTHDE